MIHYKKDVILDFQMKLVDVLITKKDIQMANQKCDMDLTFDYKRDLLKL